MEAGVIIPPGDVALRVDPQYKCIFGPRNIDGRELVRRQYWDTQAGQY